MAAITYTVKRGDSLWKICSSKEWGPKISGNSINAKINTVVALNNIKNRNLIYVGQVLVLSNSGGSNPAPAPAPAPVPAAPTTTLKTVTINTLALQSDSSTGRDVFAQWSWKRENTKNFKVRWEFDVDGEIKYETFETENTWSEYTVPKEFQEKATHVQVFVKPVAENKKNSNGSDSGIPYWSDVKEVGKQYWFSNNPPSVPPAPSCKISEQNDFILECYYENIDPADLRDATHVVFQIIKDNTYSVHVSGPVKINKETQSVKYQYNVIFGSSYKVRAKAVKTGNNTESGWSDYSSSVSTKPSVPTDIITTCRADQQIDSATGEKILSVFLEWSPVSNVTSYTIEYTTNREYFTTATNEITSINTDTAVTQWRVTGIEVGREYFFRLRANNSVGSSNPSGIVSVIVGTAPAAPTTWSSSNGSFVGESLNLYWTHNSTDNSRQTYAELWLTIDGVREPAAYTFQNGTNPNSGEEIDEQVFLYGKAISYKGSLHVELDTTHRSLKNKEIQWEVRTAGVAGFGDWSIPRTVYVYEKPVLNLSVTKDEGGTTGLIETLTEFPFYVRASVGLENYNIQRPIGYHLKITANEFYETVDDAGRTTVINNGDSVYSKYFDTTSDLIDELSADKLDLESGINYTVFCSVDMSTGLSIEGVHSFMVSWSDAQYKTNADIGIDTNSFTAIISPYCTDLDGNFVDNIFLSVYRREYDGTFTKIASDIPNDNNTSVTDPHPSLDYARYRIVARDNITGAISFFDLPSYPVGGTSVIIQWDEEWSTFDATGSNSSDGPAWSGSLLELPYNIDVTDKRKPDVSLVEYAGRKHPVSYYGTQTGESASWSVVIPKDDKDTIYALRRLSLWMGDVYVREPSGSGYWANITVSFSQNHNDVSVPVTLDLTRVEGRV